MAGRVRSDGANEADKSDGTANGANFAQQSLGGVDSAKHSASCNEKRCGSEVQPVPTVWGVAAVIRYFLTFSADAPLAEADIERVVTVLRAVPGMSQALLHTPAQARDPYLDDGPPPQLVLECDFPAIEPLEAALSLGGAFGAVGFSGAQVTQQAMLARRFAVPDPVFQTAHAAPHCTYLVSYEGVAADLNLWLSHYMAHHIPMMVRFPGLRALEVFTRIDWCSALPWRRVDFMQRNKVVFDSPAALGAALNSPVRDEMRADFHQFPPFSGKTTHYSMSTLTVIPQEVAMP